VRITFPSNGILTVFGPSQRRAHGQLLKCFAVAVPSGRMLRMFIISLGFCRAIYSTDSTNNENHAGTQ
jgi:hypothetical protein